MTRCRESEAGILTAIVVVALSLVATPAIAQGPLKPVEATIVNTPSNPVPVTAPNPLPVTVVTNRSSFTIPPVSATLTIQGGAVPPDPSGTQYAITSVTVANGSDAAQMITLAAVAGETGAAGGCRLPFNVVQTAPGPIVAVPPRETVHLAFPEPFVTAPVAGNSVCLAASANPAIVGVTWSAVGYKILP